MRSYRASEALWRDVLGTIKSGSLSCVFNSRNTADTWWVIKHKPSLPESSWGLIFVLLSLQINLQTTLLGHPSTQYLLKARSPDWMHCICKGKYICWFCSICTLTTSLSVHWIWSHPRCFKSHYRSPSPIFWKDELLAKSPLGRNKPWCLMGTERVCGVNS